MANTVTTSIVVQFSKDSGGASSSILSVEVDDRESADGGLNGGRTSFLPGDTVNLLMYKTSDVVLDAAETNLGLLAVGSQVAISKTEDITFAGETEATLRYPASSGFSYMWLGRDNGVVALTGETVLRIPEAGAGSYPVGVARVTYTTTATIYTLSHSDPGYADYGIVVFFAGHTP